MKKKDHSSASISTKKIKLSIQERDSFLTITAYCSRKESQGRPLQPCHFIDEKTGVQTI